MRFPRARTIAFLATAASLGLAPSVVEAAGFAIFEQGAKGMGFAGAFTAQASVPSAMFHNAAGIAFLKGKQVYLGGTVIAPSSEFQGANPYPGEGVVEKQNVGLLPIPTVYYSQKVGGSLALGLGVHVPYGLKTEWENPDSFTGRYISTRARLSGFAVNPTLAFKLADRLAVGAGLDVRFSSVSLEQRIPSVNPFTQKVVDVASVDLKSNTQTAYGFNLGALAKPNEHLSLGLSYRHKVKIDYAGSATFTLTPTGNAQFDDAVARSLPSGAVPFTTSIAYPGIFSSGVAYEWNDWLFEVDLNWYQWSTFDRVPLDIEGRPDLSRVVEEQYGNSFQYRFGMERRINDSISVRGGYFFDETPAPTAAVTPFLPDADRNGFALGATWTNGRLRLDGATWYVRSGARSTEGVNSERYEGTYKGSAVTLGVSLGYAF